jgi:hypothetical protein
MDLNSPLFDRIRIKPKADPKDPPRCDEVSGDAGPRCERQGCVASGQHRAPKGRGADGQYWRFCLDHVREYNHSYNYFAGMTDDAVAAYQKDAAIGHRPTWAMGVNGAAPGRGEGRKKGGEEWAYIDPLGVLGGAAFTQRRAAPEPPRRRLSAPTLKALDTLGLDENADGPTIKAQYKALVKRFHPDAHGGDRSFEERLRDIIRAHDTLKAAGLC